MIYEFTYRKRRHYDAPVSRGTIEAGDKNEARTLIRVDSRMKGMTLLTVNADTTGEGVRTIHPGDGPMPAIDNRLHEQFMILVNNAENRQKTYHGLAEKAMRDHGNDETAAASALADVLKDRFEWMVDDISLRPTKEFPRHPGGTPKGVEDDPAQERIVMVEALILHAFGFVNWLGFARDVIADLKETIRWKAENPDG
jgi:hypothetical protein